jgi:S-DNA-T family DNA segregation ATPase FtsK/SpoIIIE
VSDGAQVQIAVPGGSGSLSDVLAAGAEEVRRRWGSEGPHDLVRVRQLPSTVGVGELRTPASRRASGVGRWAVVGLGGDEAAPCGLDLDLDPVVVVSGPAGSGRTTALRTMACSLTAAAATVVTISSRGGLQGPWSVCAPDAPERLSRVLREHPNACVLVDDVELLADSATDSILVQLARRRGPTALVVAGATSTLQHAPRGAGAAARAARTGLVLQPSTPSDGEVLGVRVAIPESRLPGRGVLVVRGEQQPVQVAR